MKKQIKELVNRRETQKVMNAVFQVGTIKAMAVVNNRILRSIPVFGSVSTIVSLVAMGGSIIQGIIVSNYAGSTMTEIITDKINNW